MWCCFAARGRRGTSWHSHVFCNVSKVVSCGRRILLRRFQKMRCSILSRRSTLDVSIVILRGRHSTQTCRVACFLQIALAGLRQVATRCRFRGRRGVLWDVMKIDGSLARNIVFEVANLDVHKKTRRKTSILKLQSVKISGSLAWNARFAAPTRLWFSCGLAVSMGEVTKPLLFKGVQVVLRGRRGMSWHSNLFDNVLKLVLCGRRITFTSFSQDELQILWQAQHFGDLCRHFAWQAQHFRRVALHALNSTLPTLHSSLYTLHSTLYTLHSTLYTPHILRGIFPKKR